MPANRMTSFHSCCVSQATRSQTQASGETRSRWVRSAVGKSGDAVNPFGPKLLVVALA